MYYAGNLNSEKQQLKDKASVVHDQLGELETVLTKLEEAWQDDKSAGIVADIRKAMGEINTKVTEATEASEQALNSVEKTLNGAYKVN